MDVLELLAESFLALPELDESLVELLDELSLLVLSLLLSPLALSPLGCTQCSAS